MIDTVKVPGGQRYGGGCRVAAALGVVALAFIVDRLALAENEVQPPRKEASRDASAAGLTTTDKDHICSATTPSDIPDRRWKDILMRVFADVSDHRILALAAGMTYYSLLAIFPALAAIVAVYGLVSDPGAIAKHLDQISGFVPRGAIDVATEQLNRVASKGNQTLGLTFAIGLAVSLCSTRSTWFTARRKPGAS
jgi:membrane protein